MKAATAAESGGSPQMEECRAVAESPIQQNPKTDESRRVEGKERRVQNFDSTEHQTTKDNENIDGRVANG